MNWFLCTTCRHMHFLIHFNVVVTGIHAHTIHAHAHAHTGCKTLKRCLKSRYRVVQYSKTFIVACVLLQYERYKVKCYENTELYALTKWVLIKLNLNASANIHTVKRCGFMHYMCTCIVWALHDCVHIWHALFVCMRCACMHCNRACIAIVHALQSCMHGMYAASREHWVGSRQLILFNGAKPTFLTGNQ